jgi:hypothetical protein
MGNLLSDKESFIWEDSTIDRSEAISELNAALNEATDYEDLIFRVPDLDEINLTWGNFTEAVYSSYDEETRRLRFPWLSEMHHQTLIGLMQFFHRPTPLGATDLNSLSAEFADANNGLTGFNTAPTEERYVFDFHSWRDWHQKYVSKFSRAERILKRTYFKKFFVPKLQVPPNYIKRLIQLGQAHPIFERLDTPTTVANDTTLHHEQVQMHFKDKKKCALNINGVWKHNQFEIPSDACDQLISWGFLLPENV